MYKTRRGSFKEIVFDYSGSQNSSLWRYLLGFVILMNFSLFSFATPRKTSYFIASGV